MTSYSTTWLMDQSDVNVVAVAEQQNYFALHVEGSSNLVVWATQRPLQEIDITLVPIYEAFIALATEWNPGYDIKPNSRFAVNLGNCYMWNGYDLILDKSNTCAENAIHMYNNDKDVWIFGLSRKDPWTPKMNPMCGDLILRNQPVTYTPTPTIYAKVGKTDNTTSVIHSSTNDSWAKFDLGNATHSTFKYDSASSSWTVVLATPGTSLLKSELSTSRESDQSV